MTVDSLGMPKPLPTSLSLLWSTIHRPYYCSYKDLF